MANLALSRLARLAGLISVGLLMYPPGATALQFRLLHSFGLPIQARDDGSDGKIPGGYQPIGTMAIDRTGNLFGTALRGGAHNFGTVFRVSPAGKVTVLHNFAGGTDGSFPAGGLTIDDQGFLYGTTQAGGGGNLGTVFRLAPDGTEVVLHAFAGGSDGADPGDRPVLHASGNLYGTTPNGGCDDGNCGVAFKIDTAGQETILHTFAGVDGKRPSSPLTIGPDGSFYGTTFTGGANDDGTVFRLTPDGTESVLHSFDEVDGEEPMNAVIFDSSGNLYGTTSSKNGVGTGAVFKLRNKSLKVLHDFSTVPSEVVMDDAGNFLGTTYGDGNLRSCMGCGTIFRLNPSGDEEVLYSFGGADGSHPTSGLTPDGNGNYFGVTGQGGKFGLGTVYEITP